MPVARKISAEMVRDAIAARERGETWAGLTAAAFRRHGVRVCRTSMQKAVESHLRDVAVNEKRAQFRSEKPRSHLAVLRQIKREAEAMLEADQLTVGKLESLTRTLVAVTTAIRTIEKERRSQSQQTTESIDTAEVRERLQRMMTALRTEGAASAPRQEAARRAPQQGGT